MKKPKNQSRTKVKARTLCNRLRGVTRAAADRAKQEGQDPVLAEHAAAIHTLSKRVVKDIVEIGRRLTLSKERVGHGNWAAWLETEFAWSEGSALNFTRVYQLAEDYKSKNFTDLKIENLIIAPSALYTLGRPSMPDGVRDEIIERAVAGEAIKHSTVQEALAKHAAVQEALAPPPAADEAATTDETAAEAINTDETAAEAINTDETPPSPAADEAVAEPRPVEFVEDDPEAVWVRGLYYRAHKAIGDAQRNGDWSKYPIDRGTIEKVRQVVEAWQELYDYLKQRDGQSVH